MSATVMFLYRQGIRALHRFLCDLPLWMQAKQRDKVKKAGKLPGTPGK